MPSRSAEFALPIADIYLPRLSFVKALSALPSLAAALGVSIEEIIGLPTPRGGKRGPKSRLERQFEELRRLPKSEQEQAAQVLGAPAGRRALRSPHPAGAKAEWKERDMSLTKDKVIELIKALPDDITVDDIMEELYFKSQVDEGLDRGEGIPHEDVEKRMSRCLSR